jgi:uncharacterized membrane protein YkoI
MSSGMNWTSALLAVGALALAAGAQAQTPPFGSGFFADNPREAQRMVSLRQVEAAIRRIEPGEMLDAALVPAGSGRQLYLIKWLTPDGRRIDFEVDAASGQILSRRG